MNNLVEALPWGFLLTIAGVITLMFILALVMSEMRSRRPKVTQLRKKRKTGPSGGAIIFGLLLIVAVIWWIWRRPVGIGAGITLSLMYITLGGAFVLALISIAMFLGWIVSMTQPPSLVSPIYQRQRPRWAYRSAVIAILALVTGLTLASRDVWSPQSNSALSPTSAPQTPTVVVARQSTSTPPLVTPTITPTSIVVAVIPTETPPPPPEEGPWTRPTDNAVMVYVPEGEFLMGSTDAEVAMAISQCEIDQGVGNCEQMGFDAQMPQHAVKLDAFWIDQAEVTNAQFADFLNVRGNQVEEGIPWLEIDDDYALIEQVGDVYQPIEGYADHPVIEVSWAGAAAYCAWTGARLPTEAEWEYAARGPQSLVYPWGDTFECQHGNFDDETELDAYIVGGRAGCDGYVRTAPVGSFPSGKSWCGAWDMAGNVWEWVQDWYATDYYKLSPYQNPPGPSMGEYRIGRGGSWWSSEAWIHSTTRLKISPTGAGYDLGFRCVMTLSPDR